MKQVIICRWLAGAVVCSLLLTAGCATEDKKSAKPDTKIEKPDIKKEGATIALKFTPQDSTTYKVITESERSIKWEGSLPEESTFKGGRNYDRREVVFDQEIQSVDDKGNAIAKITIKKIKHFIMTKDNAAREFDTSDTTADPNHPLVRLVGQSYTIKIAPTGAVIEVIDTKDVETAARKGAVPPGSALRLINPETIKDRHGKLLLPDTDENKLLTGDNWSETNTFSFGMLGSESYEKIYTLNQIREQDNQQVAVIEMNAIPAVEKADMQTAEFISRSDSSKIYNGELEMDLVAGKVSKYSEKLQQEWTVDFPSSEMEAGQEPVILTMRAMRFYSLEKID